MNILINNEAVEISEENLWTDNRIKGIHGGATQYLPHPIHSLYKSYDLIAVSVSAIVIRNKDTGIYRVGGVDADGNFSLLAKPTEHATLGAAVAALPAAEEAHKTALGASLA